MKTVYRAICFILAASLFTPYAQAESLIEVYQRALRSDPQLREADAIRMAALEARPQARSALLPQLQFQWREDDSSTDGVVPFNDITGQTSQASIDTDSDTRNFRLALQQTVFRWDQWATLKQSDKRITQAEANYQAANQDLIFRVSERYFDVLAANDTLDSVQAAREAIARQLEQAQKRFEVGLIAITDVQEAQAAYDNAVAVDIGARRSLATAREFLREIVGEYIAELAEPADSMPLVSPDPANEESWVETALDQNLSLIASRLNADIARDEVKIRRTGHYPTLDLSAVLIDDDFASSGLVQPAGAVAFPTTSFRDLKTDTISLQLTVPIYSGGFVSSRVREAVYQHRAAKEQLERVARETEREARDAYLGVISEISRVKALKQALESSRTALQATEAGFEVGTRTTVDVLDARRTLFEAETNYLRSRYDYILNILRLKRASGTLDNEDLQEIDGWLSST